MKILFGEKKNFYKANLHCHSTWSDGHHTPAELKQLYKEQGYSILSITDHDGLFYHSDLDDEDFLNIAGYEMEFDEVDDPKDYNTWKVAHICIYKKNPEDMSQLGFDPEYRHPRFTWTNDPDIKKLIKGKGTPFSREYSAENINSIFEQLKNDGYVTVYNHPKWSREFYPDYIKFNGMNCLEIFNYGSYCVGHDEYNGDVYDDMLLAGKRIFCVAGDDNHQLVDYVHADMFGGFTVFNADELKYSAIMEAFENGDFYASAGPEIKEISFDEENNVFSIKTGENVKRITLRTGNRHSGAWYNADGSAVDCAEAKLVGNEKFARWEVELFDGKKAFSQAYFLEDLITACKD